MTASSFALTLERTSENLDFTGVICLSQGDSLIFEKAKGWANRSDRIPNDTATRLAVASGSKGFTAVAVLQLVEQGLISLDSRLSDCLAIDFPGTDPRVTVRHLLTHTSGMPYYFDEAANPDYEAVWRDRPMYRMLRPMDYLPMFQHEPQVFPPGERFAYNDAAFIVLGLIVEQHTGMSYIDYVTKEILIRAGMTDSGYFSTDHLPEKVATGYIDTDGGAWRTNTFAVPIIGGPDGGAYVTARDMASFWSALMGHRLLGDELTREMLQPHVKAETEGPNIHYGLGMWTRMQSEKVVSYYLTGWDPGAAFNSEYFVDSKLLLTFISNSNRDFEKTYRTILRVIAAG